jgi:hypothetical protein
MCSIPAEKLPDGSGRDRHNHSALIVEIAELSRSPLKGRNPDFRGCILGRGVS